MVSLPMGRVRIRMIAVSLLAGLACGNPANVRIDLASLSSCRIEDRIAEVPRVGSESTTLLQPGGSPLDFFLRLPKAARFRVRLPRDIDTETVSILLTSATQHRALAPRGSTPVDEFSGELVRLRFENRSDTAVQWVEPHFTGTLEEVPSPLTRGRDLDRPNILLYVVDALRPDHLGAYGYPLPTSPRLDAMAGRSLLFESAYSTGPRTMDAIPSLFTSVPRGEVWGRLRPGPKAIPHTLAEQFRGAGYATAAFQANFWVGKALGFDRGFDTYKVVTDESENRDSKFPRATAEQLHGRVLEWLDRDRDAPFFLFVQSLDVHHPYAPPAPFFGRFAEHHANRAGKDLLADLPGFVATMQPAQRRLYRKLLGDLKPEHYDDAVAYADHEWGAFLDALDARGLLENTVVVVTADHGESLGEGGRYLHGLSLNEELVRIPLLIALPGQTRAQRINEIASLMDLGPTLLAMADVAVPDQFEGRNLLRSHPTHRAAAAVGDTGTIQFFVREGPWKLIVIGDEIKLFDLRSDPTEARDRSAEHPIQTRYMLGLLWDRIETSRRGAAQPLPMDHGLEQEEREELEDALRSLGYIE